MLLPRTRLPARLFASEARLIRLLAPPGYGKTGLARIFARRFDDHAICDCSGVTDVVTFAARAITALAGEAQDGDAIAAERLRLHAIGAEGAIFSRSLLRIWSAGNERSLFVIEHAEAIAENPAVLAVLGDLLAARRPERVILISSTVDVPLRYAAYLAPQQILTLTSQELRWTDDEAVALFEGTDVPSETVNRIVRIAAGWPVVLALLAKIAQYETDVEALLDRLADLPSENRYESLAKEIISAFTPEMTAALIAAASIPNASLEDIWAAIGARHHAWFVDRLSELPGFITNEGGVYRVHPLLHGVLRAEHGIESGSDVDRAGTECERTGDYLRAAELYSDERAAAAALERLPSGVLERPSMRLIEALAKISMPVLCEYPQLWIATLPYRRQSAGARRLYDEARSLLAALPPDGPAALRRRLLVRLAALAVDVGDIAEARALLEGGEAGTVDDDSDERRLALMTAALVAAKRGHFTQADRFVSEADAVVGSRRVRFDAERGAIALERMLLSGDWHGALKVKEEELYAARRSTDTSRIVEAARGVARVAWYCDDEDGVTAAAEILLDCGDRETLPFAQWHAALAAPDGARARDLFDRAIESADASQNTFLQTAIRVCSALLLPQERGRLLEAREIAANVESAPLHASLEALIDSTEPPDQGIFKHLAARVGRSPLKSGQDEFRVEVLRGRVRRGAATVHVSDRGFELLCALALLPAGMPKEDVARAIWPRLDRDAALNTLKMCVSRTRAQLGGREIIQNTRRGYSLGERVAVDIREHERLLRHVRGAEVLGDAARRQIEEAQSALAGRERAHTARWPWFVPFAERLDELRGEFEAALAKAATRRADGEAPPGSEGNGRYAASSL